MALRPRIGRQLDSLLSSQHSAIKAAKSLDGSAAPPPPAVPSEFTPREFTVMLLHVAAAIEHALMVEYLYAAFTLGGPHVPVEHHAEVLQWQETILGIAKEEMGHLMTVQNLLRCLGGPLNFDREDYPWDSELYPFPFRLEPLSRQSLAKYVVAESPDEFQGAEADEIKRLALEGTDGRDVRRVGTLYSLLLSLIGDSNRLADADFRGSTYPFQATWDEWGRGYRLGARGTTSGAAMPQTPDVLILPIASRSDAIRALEAIATQGEANPQADDSAPSHFARFVRIFRAFPKGSSWSPVRSAPVNPVAVTSTDGENHENWGGTPITNAETKLWAHLFNIRYRLLLTQLQHTFEYPNNVGDGGSITPRALLLNGTFGEMYNLRAIAQTLVRMPMSSGEDALVAGPPFQMPYTLRVPVDETDRWRLHLDMIEASDEIAKELIHRSTTDHAGRLYLEALRQTDQATRDSIRAIKQNRDARIGMARSSS